MLHSAAIKTSFDFWFIDILSKSTQPGHPSVGRHDEYQLRQNVTSTPRDPTAMIRRLAV